MKIQFDYNEVSADVVKTVLEQFYNTYKSDDIQFGAINLYITVRDKEDNSNIGWINKLTGKEVEYYVKSKPLKKTKKKLVDTIYKYSEDSEEKEPIAYVYLK